MIFIIIILACKEAVKSGKYKMGKYKSSENITEKNYFNNRTAKNWNS